jgi:hypothetical protein
MEVLEDRSCIFKKYDFLKKVNLDLSMAQHERGAEDVGCIGRWT